MEGAATTVYAQGGRGNARLVAWEGERTVTFTMEDALISPIGFMILSGAGLIEASEENTIKMHTTEQTDKVVVSQDGNTVTISLSQKPYINESRKSEEDFIYVMQLKDGEVVSEPYIPAEVTPAEVTVSGVVRWNVVLHAEESGNNISMTGGRKNDLSNFHSGDVVLVDYYVEKKSGAFQVDITPDKFGGNYYLEASTLFRDTNGVDMPAEFVIPNCKVQSNFTFTMASSGDPSTFTFTMDAFPDYTRWNKTKKVLAAIQVLDTSSENRDFSRLGTAHDNEEVADQYNANQKPFIEID